MNDIFSELDLILRFPWLKHNDGILIDVGAHYGVWTKAFADKGWQVVAFEPEPENRAGLQNNIQNYPNVTVIAKAVSDVAGQEIPFYVSSEHYGIHSLKPFHPTHKPTLTVETVRLDDTLDELGVEQVAILKIDIEGADFLAIKSFDFDKYQPEVVICEFMDERSQSNFGYTHHDVVAYMKGYGYKSFVAEWAPIVEYGRKEVPEGTVAPQHQFLQCVPYPLDHEPAWGNLIFVPENRVKDFQNALTIYSRRLKITQVEMIVRAFLKKIPGLHQLYRAVRSYIR